MLIDKIRADMIQARKTGSGVAKSLLVTLFAEASRVGKDKRNGLSTDEECISVIRKFAANADETYKILSGCGKDTSALTQELAILQSYLPQQMTVDELTVVIEQIVLDQNLSGPKAIGQVMANLKASHAGKYDGKMASDIVKKVFS